MVTNQSKSESRKSKTRRFSLFAPLLLSLVTLSAAKNLLSQQPQTSTAPIYSVNAKYVQGLGPGYWPTKGSGLTLNLASGTAYCGVLPVPVAYGGGTLTMMDDATNSIYLDPVAACVPASNITGFLAGHIPIATVVTTGGAITTITDCRTWFAPQPCTVDSDGSVVCQALGADASMYFVPTGAGYNIFYGRIGIGIEPPMYKLDILDDNASIAGFRITNPNVGATAMIQNKLENDVGSFAYYGIASSNFTGFPPINGGKAFFGAYLTDVSIFTQEVHDIIFYTTAVERARINSGGNFGIGKTAGANAQLDVAKTIASGLNTVAYSATPTFDASMGNTQKITLAGNVTSSTLSNASAGQQIDFLICQDNTGSRTFAWPTNILGGMTIGATASKCSAQSFRYDATLAKAYAASAGVTNM